MPGSSSLELSETLEQRIRAASSVLHLSCETFLARLLSQYYNTLGGLPRDLLRYIFTFLDYSTISATLTRVCRLWQGCVVEDPLHFFAHLRQIHGIHLLDPAHGLFFFPRALKRVMIESQSSTSSPLPTVSSAASPASTGSRAPASAAAASDTGGTRHAATDNRINVVSRATRPTDVNSAKVVPASSFLTVDIRTQNTKSLPWGNVRETVQWAIAEERMLYGEVRTPGLQQSEDPVWSQAATIAYDRRIYMFGGETYEGVVLDRAYEYDPMTKHWTVLPTLSEKRAAASAVAYKGYIFVFGGYNTEEGVLDTYEVLEVKTQTWISHLHSPQCLYKQQKQKKAQTLADAREAPETVGQHTADARDDDSGHTRRALRSSGAAVANATWPFTAVPQPGWTRSGCRTAVSRQYRMPKKVCGTAVTVHGDVFLLAGGHQSRIAPEQTAVSYSAVNSTSTTPMHALPGGADDGTDSDIATSTASPSALDASHSPQRLGSINAMSQAMAESFVWIFCPRTGRWWTQGPCLPSPRAFGAMTVLELPILGPCLCYFGGCARADTPETAMFYIPLCTAAETHSLTDVKANGGADGSLKKSPDTPPGSIATASRTTAKRLDGTQEEGADAEMSGGTTANTTVAGTRREAPGARGAARRNCRETRAAPTAAVDCGVAPPTEPLGAKGAVSRTAAGGGADDTECFCGAAHGARWITPTNDFTPEQHQRIRERGERVVSRPVASTSADAASCGRFDDDDAILLRAEADTTMISRCFRNPSGLPWQRYVRIPIGGAFTSVVVLGAPNSRSLVLTGFYPAPNIGFCKVNHLLPPDAFFPLLGALALPLTAQAEAAEPLPRGQYATAAHARSDAPPPPPPPTSSRATAADTPLGVTTAAVATASSPMPPLDPGLQDEATAAVNHWHQEREWSHHHRREIREMVRSAAHAATMRHPRNPQTAGEEHKWSLSPVPEVRVVSRNSHSFLRVSWKVQTLNAKVIVGIE